MKKIFFSVIVITVLKSCTTHNNTSTTSILSTDSIIGNEIKKDSFFPVTSFIKGQMILMDSLPVTPLHTITINHKTDSVWLKKAQLFPLLADFISPEIKETNLTSYFKETSFNDLTLNTVTMTYDPVTVLPDSLSLRHWDIYINPESGNVVKVYIVKQLKNKDGLVTQQLTWKTNKWAMITTLLNKPNDSTQILKEDKFIWNFSE
jgi:hypothetical protein